MWRDGGVETRLSRDGGLRVDLRTGVWDVDPPEAGRWAIISDAATGEALFDGAAIRHHNILWRDDGAILIRVADYAREGMVRVDPAARSFRDLTADDARDRPLAELQAGVEGVARRIGALPAAYAERDQDEHGFSPDGRFRIDYHMRDWLMSHETRSPTLVDVADGAVLLSLYEDWDGSPQWLMPDRLRLGLRRYTYPNGWLSLLIDLPGRRCWIGDEQGKLLKLPGAEPAIEKAFQASLKARKDGIKSPATHSQASFGKRLLYVVMALGVALLMMAAIILIWPPEHEAPFVAPPVPRPSVID